MARRIATVSGIALRPGVSRNGRLYTKDMIARAVAEAQDRIEAGDAKFRYPEEESGDPLSQRTHHAADDDSTRIVGRVTSLRVNGEGAAEFEADLADTDHGQTINRLVAPKLDPNDPDDVDAFLKGVSIRGAWSGTVKTVMHDGQAVERGDNLHIFGLDYTGTPGVLGAQITGYRRAGTVTRESATDRVPIYESIMEGQVGTMEIEEKGAPPTKSGKPAAPPTKAPAGSYADPGYQGDKAKRYPLDTKKRAKAAWGYINQATQAKNYSSAQLKRIKGRTKAALKKFGVEVTDESWLIDRIQLTESESVQENLHESNSGSFEVCLDNGMVCVRVSSYCVDPHDLDALGIAAMTAACAALEKMDPDMDGDIDVDGAPSEDTDRDMESIKDDTMESTVDEQNPVTENDTTAPEPVADDHESEVATVSEPTAPASEIPAAVTPAPVATTVKEDKKVEPTALDLLSAKFDKLTDAISGLVTKMAAPVAAMESAPVAPVSVVETEDQRIARLVDERWASQKTKMIQDLVESGQAPGRKGLVAPVTETTAVRGTEADEYPVGWPEKDGQPVEPHTLSQAEFRRLTRPMLEQVVMGNRSVYRQQ